MIVGLDSQKNSLGPANDAFKGPANDAFKIIRSNNCVLKFEPISEKKYYQTFWNQEFKNLNLF